MRHADQKAETRGAIRLNLGCGPTPTEGWFNYDNSLTVRISRSPLVTAVLSRLRLLSASQQAFAHVAAGGRVEWADAVQRIPWPDVSVDAIYSSHMLEHLNRQAARSFLIEVLRVLVPGGVLRLAIPDLAIMVRHYVESGDADAFIERTLLSRDHEQYPSVKDKVQRLFVGDRNHAWMYDGESVVKLLASLGFKDSVILPPGQTVIADSGSLDLWERCDETVYVEALKA